MYTIVAVEARVTHVATRIPFRYGIAEMVAAPHVVVQVTVERDGASRDGWASEHLPPKWFTKDPDSLFADEVRDMVSVIENAVEVARGLSAGSPFGLWEQLQAAQDDWAESTGVPGLLAGLGSAIVERAIIDAACRLIGLPFAEALRSGALGFDAASIHPELAGQRLDEAFPVRDTATIAIRHTVGLSDPLTDDDVESRPADDLPVSLQSIIDTYGVTHFKIKTAGRLEDDIPRLTRILDIVDAAGIEPTLTIDGNESMKTAQHLVDWTRGLLADPCLAPVLRQHLVAVEQPFHRSLAFSADVARALEVLGTDVAVIIDESDHSTTAVREAMDLGYAGGTYKGCKGVFRGLANAALVKHRAGRSVLTAEDLSTIPPLTVPQDLVVAHVMGLTHIERNGHHYFGQLAPLQGDIGDVALAAHPDVYERHADGRVRLRIEDGSVRIDTLLSSPFGFAGELSIAGLEPLSAEVAARGM